jgi:hypothetical protein
LRSLTSWWSNDLHITRARDSTTNISWYMNLWNVVNYGYLMIFLGYNSYSAMISIHEFGIGTMGWTMSWYTAGWG